MAISSNERELWMKKGFKLLIKIKSNYCLLCRVQYRELPVKRNVYRNFIESERMLNKRKEREWFICKRRKQISRIKRGTECVSSTKAREIPDIFNSEFSTKMKFHRYPSRDFSFTEYVKLCNNVANATCNPDGAFGKRREASSTRGKCKFHSGRDPFQRNEPHKKLQNVQPPWA